MFAKLPFLSFYFYIVLILEVERYHATFTDGAINCATDGAV
jgi:hypothetical protein